MIAEPHTLWDWAKLGNALLFQMFTLPIVAYVKATMHPILVSIMVKGVSFHYRSHSKHLDERSSQNTWPTIKLMTKSENSKALELDQVSTCKFFTTTNSILNRSIHVKETNL